MIVRYVLGDDVCAACGETAGKSERLPPMIPDAHSIAPNEGDLVTVWWDPRGTQYLTCRVEQLVWEPQQNRVIVHLCLALAELVAREAS